MTSDPGFESVLLDTNAFLFFIANDPRLSSTAKEVFESNADLYISVVSLWEIAIKVSIGKLALPGPFEGFIPAQLAQNEIEILPIALSHLHRVSNLSFHHKDPFDRLLAAQSFVRRETNLVIITFIFGSWT